MHCLLQAGLLQFINKQAFKWTYFILKFHCFMLLLNFITSKYSFFRRII